jgi:hypothetical protein
MGSRAWQPSLAKFVRFPSRIWRFDWLRAYLTLDLEATPKPCQATLIATLKVLTKTPTDALLLLDQLAPRFGWRNQLTEGFFRNYQYPGKPSVTYSFNYSLRTKREEVFEDVWDVYESRRSYARFKAHFTELGSRWSIVQSKMSFAQFAKDMINVFAGEPTDIILTENDLPNF